MRSLYSYNDAVGIAPSFDHPLVSKLGFIVILDATTNIIIRLKELLNFNTEFIIKNVLFNQIYHN